MQRPENHFTQTTVLSEIKRYFTRTLLIEDVWRVMDAVNLPRALASASPRTLSSGEQRLLALSCALAAQPDVLILDEPMAGLDAPHRRLVADALRGLYAAQALGLCIVSHHPDDLIGFVNRLCVMHMGSILYDGD